MRYLRPTRFANLSLSVALAVVALTAALQFRPEGGLAEPEKTGYPNSIAAVGDSITRATNSDALGDQPHNSWSTGTSSSVQSFYYRILQQNAAISGNNYNDAVAGAKMANLDAQVTTVNGQGVDLVTILMGANDVCTGSEATMTPVATFRAQFEQGMATLSAGSPDARIAVASIPDVYNLWAIHKDTLLARFMWSTFSICQSLLADPLSTAQEDVDRRNNVSQRNIDFNAVLEDVCSQYIHCGFDDNATFNIAFEPADISTIDYFHPSVAGLAKGAGAGWNAIFDFTDSVAPVSAATTTPVDGGMSISITATDDVGVAGIEYEINGGPYQRYDGPVTVLVGDTITYRAVDVNGNVEASHDLTACTATGWPVPVGDSDCDGFTTDDENFMGTNPDLACGLDAWPPDVNNSTRVDVVDAILFAPVILSNPGDPEYDARFNLDTEGGIDIIDVLLLGPVILESCTNP